MFHGLANYGTQAGLFAQELRNQGVEAISVVSKDIYKRKIDVELYQGRNFFQRVLKMLWSIPRKTYWFFKYNTFHFYYGKTLLRGQLDLPFYKLFGKKVVMEYLGWDVQLYQYSLDKYEITNVKYHKPHDVAAKADLRKTARLKSESRYVDKQFVCAPCYSEFVDGAEVLPLAVDLSRHPYFPKQVPEGKINVMHAPTSRGNKGTSYVLKALNRLVDEGFDIEISLVENVTHDEIKEKYKECDLFIDQVLCGWYGTAAIEAMATGRPVICFLRKSYFEHIDFGGEIPIINANPKTIYEVMKQTILDKDKLPGIGKKSRLFVEKHHDVKKLTGKLISFYEQLHGRQCNL